MRSDLIVRLLFGLAQVGLTVSGRTLQGISGAINVCDDFVLLSDVYDVFTSSVRFNKGTLALTFCSWLWVQLGYML